MLLRSVRRGLAAVGLAACLALIGQTAAFAATVNVSIVDNAFNPSSVKPKQGDTVMWTNTGANLHTTTSDTAGGGIGLWSSPSLAHNATFNVTLNFAGKYPYHCTIHPSMVASATVALKASPASGPAGTLFSITFGKVNVPAGFNVDIQIKRPGDAGFSDWKVNITAGKKTSFNSTGEDPGVYQFRARLQNSTTNGASQYSAAKKITVT
jgi:plastocyanin